MYDLLIVFLIVVLLFTVLIYLVNRKNKVVLLVYEIILYLGLSSILVYLVMMYLF